MQKVGNRVRTSIPVGAYLLDTTARVNVITQGSEQFISFTPHRQVKIVTASFGQVGWEITYNLGVKKTTGVLTKERKP